MEWRGEPVLHSKLGHAGPPSQIPMFINLQISLSPCQAIIRSQMRVWCDADATKMHQPEVGGYEAGHSLGCRV
jgi:hypothetical protein